MSVFLPFASPYFSSFALQMIVRTILMHYLDMFEIFPLSPLLNPHYGFSLWTSHQSLKTSTYQQFLLPLQRLVPDVSHSATLIDSSSSPRFFLYHQSWWTLILQASVISTCLTALLEIRCLGLILQVSVVSPFPQNFLKPHCSIDNSYSIAQTLEILP